MHSVRWESERVAIGGFDIVLRIGLISDTHGLLRPQAVAALRGSDYIIHAGDIGNARILEELGAIAPVTAVRGNNDHGDWAAAVPERAVLEAHGRRIYVLHNLVELDAASAVQYSAVVSGHSHRPRKDRRGNVLYINPGSAGPRRFGLPVSLGELLVDDEGLIQARLITLDAL